MRYSKKWKILEIRQRVEKKSVKYEYILNEMYVLTVEISVFFWRKERDSNSRYSSPYTPFPGGRLKPLGHLSELSQIHLAEQVYLKKETILHVLKF